MATPLPSQQPAPDYLDFFGMARAPFERPTAPSEVFRSDQCALLDSHLADAADQPGSLILVCGADGAGKTTLLNKYLSGLGDDLCFAAFDETCADGAQFYSSFLAQIGFGEINGSLHELQGITREFLIHCGRSGRPVLLFLDDAQLARPSVLEQLRSAAELKTGNEHVISIVLAGNGNLPRIIESPAMRSLKSRHETRFHIRAYSEIETNDYVRHRLDLAKAADTVTFSEASFALIYRFTGGIPGAINRLCHAALTESCARGTRLVDEQRIRSVAAAHRFLPRVMSMRGRRRRKTDRDLPPDTALRLDASWQASLPQQDLALDELLLQLAELSGQLEAATKEKHVALRDVARRDDELRQLRGRLDSSTRDLAESQARLAERERAAETLAANAAELAVLKRVLADGNEALLQRDTSSQDLVAALENERSSAQRAISALAETRECMRILEKENAEYRTSVEELHADLLAAAWTNEKVGVLEKSLEVSRQENAALRRQLQSLESPQRLVRDQDDRTAEAGADPDCHREASGGAEYLELFLDGLLIRVLELSGGPSQVLVGRAHDCELKLDSRFVSRHHALISRCEDRVIIEDLNSHNGIFVDSRRVSRCDLQPGNTVAIGNFRLHFRRGPPGKAIGGSARPASSATECADK